MPALFFLRHGETDYNAQGRIQGRLDVPLNMRGRDQAAGAAPDLVKSILKHGFDPARLPWTASPLIRARETTTILRSAMGLVPDAFNTDERLVEIGFGTWQDMTWPEIASAFPDAVAQRDAGEWDFIPPDGESYAVLVERIRPFFAAIKDPHIVVAHGGVARALMVLAAGMDPAKAVSQPVFQGRTLLFEDGRCAWL